MKNESLAFDGAAGDGVNRAGNKYAKNQWSGHSNDGRDVKFGRGPTRGNNGECHNPGTPGKSVTMDPYRRAADTARGGKINGGATVKKPTNIDKINVG